MIKRKICLLLTLSLLLTGCSSVNMTQAESGQVAEYIAYSLLKYHKNPNVFVTETKEPVSEEDSTKEPSASTVPSNGTEAQPTNEPTKSPLGTTAPVQKETNAGELFGSNDFKITIRNKGLYTSYPKNSSSTYFSLSANEGKKLLVLELNAKNTGTSKQIFKTSGTGLGYTLNGNNSDKALVTILEHDIHFVKETVKSGKSVKAFVFFEVDKNFDDSNLKLTITKSEKSVSLSVK